MGFFLINWHSNDRDLALNLADRMRLLMEGRLKLVTTPAGLHDPEEPGIGEFPAQRIGPRFKVVQE